MKANTIAMNEAPVDYNTIYLCICTYLTTLLASWHTHWLLQFAAYGTTITAFIHNSLKLYFFLKRHFISKISKSTTMNFTSFIKANKVTIFGCLMAVLMVFQQFELQGPVDLKVVGLAALVAAIGFLAKNLRGQAATILASLLPSLGVIATAAQNHAPISWSQTITSAAIAIIGVFLPPMKNLSYEEAPTIVAAKNTITKVAAILIICLGFMFSSHAQTPFKKQPNLTVPQRNYFFSTGVFNQDSLVNTWRFTASISPFVYTFGGAGYSVAAGSEFGYKHQDYNYTTQTYTTLYSINAAWVPVASNDSIKGLADVLHFAILGGFYDDLIQIGPMWNPNNPKGQKWGIMLALGIKL